VPSVDAAEIAGVICARVKQIAQRFGVIPVRAMKVLEGRGAVWLAGGSAGLGSVHGATGSRRGQRGTARRSPGARRKKRKRGEGAGAWDRVAASERESG
jgi:hypothetical protein